MEDKKSYSISVYMREDNILSLNISKAYIENFVEWYSNNHKGYSESFKLKESGVTVYVNKKDIIYFTYSEITTDENEDEDMELEVW